MDAPPTAVVPGSAPWDRRRLSLVSVADTATKDTIVVPSAPLGELDVEAFLHVLERIGHALGPAESCLQIGHQRRGLVEGEHREILLDERFENDIGQFVDEGLVV